MKRKHRPPPSEMQPDTEKARCTACGKVRKIVMWSGGLGSHQLLCKPCAVADFKGFFHYIKFAVTFDFGQPCR